MASGCLRYGSVRRPRRCGWDPTTPRRRQRLHLMRGSTTAVQNGVEASTSLTLLACLVLPSTSVTSLPRTGRRPFRDWRKIMPKLAHHRFSKPICLSFECCHFAHVATLAIVCPGILCIILYISGNCYRFVG